MKKTVNALGGLARAMMCRFKGVIEVIVFMQALSNEEEEFINKNGYILLTMKDNSKVEITLEDIYMYGNVIQKKKKQLILLEIVNQLLLLEMKNLGCLVNLIMKKELLV